MTTTTRPQRRDLTGQRFGRWLVIARDKNPTRTDGHRDWLCRCDCGIERVCQPHALRTGRSSSCGCFSRESVATRATTHGETKNRTATKEYRAWKDAVARCHRPSHLCFKHYGAKGVTVCEGWRHNFSAFLRDLGRAPAGYSLDRINPVGNYEPQNCRWTDRRTQSLNRRTPILQVEYNGAQYTAKELARKFGVDGKALLHRLRRGEEATIAIRAIQSHRPNRLYPAST